MLNLTGNVSLRRLVGALVGRSLIASRLGVCAADQLFRTADKNIRYHQKLAGPKIVVDVFRLNYNEGMGFDDYKLVIYRNQPEGWVAEIPAIAGCHALMPTAEEAVSELALVFRMIEEEYRADGQTLPRDTTEIVHA